jgi:predicted nucleotidyltransferase
MPVSELQIDRCTAIARSFGATKLILFGSAADSPETAGDLDVACEGIAGWDLFRLGAKLEEELHTQVDVIALQPDDRLSRYIAKTGRVLYETK